MRMLASWIGLADLSAPAALPNDVGPIAAALGTGGFDRALLLADARAPDLDRYLAWLAPRAPAVALDVERVALADPSDFPGVFRAVAGALDARADELRGAAELALYLSPGTPVMAATWLILGKTRYRHHPVTFLESSRRRVRRLDAPFDLAGAILPDVLDAADERLARGAAGHADADAAFDAILHRGPAMAALLRLARRAAPRTLPVLIEGESGTGKELIARAIHRAGAAAGAPFVAVNCGAIPSELVESALFGHVKGAFTGATAAHRGYLEAADGGTLFLDEVGELPLPAQVKLLRALQEGEVVPVGATAPRPVRFRLLSATNRPLVAEAAAGRFREDLFYRLCVIRLAVPPLRDRGEDLDLLIDRLLADAQGGTGPRPLDADARALLLAHPWPGNVRELGNCLHRLVFLAEGPTLTTADARAALLVAPGSAGFDLRAAERAFRRQHIDRALAQSRNVTEAARLLGVSRQLLAHWLREGDQGADHQPDTPEPPKKPRSSD